MPLSTLSLDESGPPEVTEGVHVPLVASTLNSTPPQQDSALVDSYQQILPGVPQGSLYPTLAAMNDQQSDTVPTVICTLHNRVIINMDKYMKEVKQACKLNDNYFDAVTRSTNTSPIPETPASKSVPLEQDLNDVQNKSQQGKQLTTDKLESLNEDTGQ